MLAMVAISQVTWGGSSLPIPQHNLSHGVGILLESAPHHFAPSYQPAKITATNDFKMKLQSVPLLACGSFISLLVNLIEETLKNVYMLVGGGLNFPFLLAPKLQNYP
jgi:hypothetical protein